MELSCIDLTFKVDTPSYDVFGLLLSVSSSWKAIISNVSYPCFETSNLTTHQSNLNVQIFLQCLVRNISILKSTKI